MTVLKIECPYYQVWKEKPPRNEKMWAHAKRRSLSHRAFYEPPRDEPVGGGVCGGGHRGGRAESVVAFHSVPGTGSRKPLTFVARSSGGVPASNYISVFKY